MTPRSTVPALLFLGLLTSAPGLRADVFDDIEKHVAKKRHELAVTAMKLEMTLHKLVQSEVLPASVAEELENHHIPETLLTDHFIFSNPDAGETIIEDLSKKRRSLDRFRARMVKIKAGEDKRVNRFYTRKALARRIPTYFNIARLRLLQLLPDLPSELTDTPVLVTSPDLVPYVRFFAAAEQAFLAAGHDIDYREDLEGWGGLTTTKISEMFVVGELRAQLGAPPEEDSDVLGAEDEADRDQERGVQGPFGLSQ